jgi:hypothetical protein
MRGLFADLLPDSVLARTSKATFTEAYFGPMSRRFAREWDGRAGIDPTIVDSEALRSIWLSPRPNFLTTTLLQAAWLASNPPARDNCTDSLPHDTV